MRGFRFPERLIEVRAALTTRGQKPQRRKSLLGVASGRLAVAAGAQDPQCTRLYMRNPSTAGRRQAPAQ